MVTFVIICFDNLYYLTCLETILTTCRFVDVFVHQESVLESVTEKNAQLTSVNAKLQLQVAQLSKVRHCHMAAARGTSHAYYVKVSVQ